MVQQDTQTSTSLVKKFFSLGRILIPMQSACPITITNLFFSLQDDCKAGVTVINKYEQKREENINELIAQESTEEKYECKEICDESQEKILEKSLWSQPPLTLDKIEVDLGITGKYQHDKDKGMNQVITQESTEEECECQDSLSYIPEIIEDLFSGENVLT
ncbi:uncharacterized protein [Notamacropus eugenii]|uniref:uncharacterized protein isoform X4 n=1 Tax=Notamacropus eugenii TaxID=9315 RepID=UPI003B67891E